MNLPFPSALCGCASLAGCELRRRSVVVWRRGSPEESEGEGDWEFEPRLCLA